MFQRLLLGIMLLVAGFVFGWQIRANLAIKDCEQAGGTWNPPGICAGAR